MTSDILPYEVAETLRFKKSQYCRFADTHDWDSFASLMLPSLSASFTGPDGEIATENGVRYYFATRDEFVAFFRAAFETQQTIHVVGPGELRRVSEDEVSAIWSVVYHAASHGVTGGWKGSGGGQYHETWKKVDGEWRMASLKMVRVYWKVQQLGEGEEEK
ncbi:hypothetical protein HK57_00155 [Aspergillus ustus]|uniref:SnoaL-like domain-containing protein n=1 Tax=Aspergillus ustus TaxID=40382 RepID=A0A0C1E1E1_ASPUT|nr:hypothetical protein HK57_00155 [Aspergillus ustus]